MSEYQQVLYQEPALHVARIVMNRPDKLNAQGTVMTYELDDAFKRACQDENIHVIILASTGRSFSSGHDLSGEEPIMPSQDQTVGLWGEFYAEGWEGHYSREREVYLEMTERWRNASKPTIAEVQGACIAGGLMLAWACDLIVCSEDARFRDNTAAEMGIPGVEFFQHPFELGVRRAKEWLFTGGWLDAADARILGMVNHVVPLQDLPAKALEVACKIASNDRFTMKLVKQAMNKSQDLMGRKDAMDAAFSLHQMAHMQYMLTTGFPISISRLHPSVRARLEEIGRNGRGHSAPEKSEA